MSSMIFKGLCHSVLLPKSLCVWLRRQWQQEELQWETAERKEAWGEQGWGRRGWKGSLDGKAEAWVVREINQRWDCLFCWLFLDLCRRQGHMLRIKANVPFKQKKPSLGFMFSVLWTLIFSIEVGSRYTGKEKSPFGCPGLDIKDVDETFPQMKTWYHFLSLASSAAA